MIEGRAGNQIINMFLKAKDIFKNTHCVALTKNFLKNICLVSINRLPSIKYLVYEVIDSCNSRCRHCRIWQRPLRSDLLTAFELGAMLKQGIFDALQVVLLTGGEPVLRNDIKEVISVIHNIRPKARMTLSTNGLLPERVLEVFEFALERGIPLALGVSLDGVGDKHDQIRGVAGNFKKVDYLLREAVKLKTAHKNKNEDVSIGIGFTLSNATVSNFKEVMDYVKGLRVKSIIQLYEEFPFYGNQPQGGEGSALNYKKSDNDKLVSLVRMQPPAFHNEILLYALRHRLRFRCDALRDFLVLRAGGEVVPCLCYYDSVVGNIREKPLRDILKSPSTRQAKNKVRRCQGCSNGWATDWSYQEWAPYFWRILLSLYFKKFLYKFKKSR